MAWFAEVLNIHPRSSLVGKETLFSAPCFVGLPAPASWGCHVANSLIKASHEYTLFPMNTRYSPYMNRAAPGFSTELLFSQVGLRNYQLMLLDIL